MIEVYMGDNLPILESFISNSIDLIYIDPPFNTQKTQKRITQKVVMMEDGSKSLEKIQEKSYEDKFDNLVDFLRPRMIEAHRILKDNGSLFFHIDCRESHYCKIMLDEIFGKSNFMNEIIWAYDYGARSKKKWPWKHDNIFWYAKDSQNYTYNYDQIDLIPKLAPGLFGGSDQKTPTDVWWHTIVPTNGSEKTGYPTQKPLGIINRIVKVHSNKGDQLLDFFAGSGTLGESALSLERNCILIDQNPQSIEVIKQRFGEQFVLKNSGSESII